MIVQDAFEINPEAGSETQYARHQLLQAALDCMEKGVKVTQTAIAEEIIGVIQDGGMAKLKEYLEDYPNSAQAKVLGLLWGLMDTESDFISEQLKT